MKPSELKESDSLTLVTEGGIEARFSREYGALDLTIGPPLSEIEDVAHGEYFIPGTTQISEKGLRQRVQIDEHAAKQVYLRFSDDEDHQPTEDAADKIYAGMLHWMKEK